MRPLARIADTLENAALLALVGVEWLETGIAFVPTRPALRVDPHPFYRALRERDPVHRSRAADGWVLTRHADVAAVLADRGFSADERNLRRWPWVQRRLRRGGLPDPYEENIASMLRLDPPDHTRLRGLVNQAFTPRAVDRLRGRMEEMVEALLAGPARRGRMELVGELAAPLPVMVIAEMLGVPVEDRDRFRHWSDEVVRLLGDSTREDERRAWAARAELHAYFSDICERRRAEPRDDLLSALLRAEAEGERLARPELLSVLVLLLVAGNETTAKLIGNGVLALLDHPDQLALLREEPARIPAAVEEILRYDGPVQLTSRIALEDGELCGRPIRRGQEAVLCIAAANRDPARYADPDRLDVTREDVRPLSFGHGIHHCLGARLARLEARVALEALVTRFPDLRRGEGPVEWGSNTVLRGPRRLPLAL